LSEASLKNELEALKEENFKLRLRLEEAEQTLTAIRQGAVDALVIAGPDGDNVFTLAGSEHNYRLLIESIDEGALTATHEGTILYCNTKFSRMMDQPAETLVGREIADFVEPSQRSAFEMFLADGTSQSLEVAFQIKPGPPLATKVSRGLLDADGLSGISLVVTDLTQTKMATELVTANAELSRSNAELARFAFVASHDLKEPLRVISSYVQMLDLRLKEKLDAGTANYMKYVVDAVARMYALINDLLAYSKIGADLEAFTEVDTNLLVREVRSNLSTSLNECDGEIVCSPLPTVWGNRGELLQLFQNILGNAIKYRAHRPPKINVEARREGFGWVFSVTDNGIGIERQYFEKIFVIFQRLHGKQCYSGTGIGLAICKKVVERHGGKIWVEAAPEYGTTFLFSIPDSTRKDADVEAGQ